MICPTVPLSPAVNTCCRFGIKAFSAYDAVTAYEALMAVSLEIACELLTDVSLNVEYDDEIEVSLITA